MSYNSKHKSREIEAILDSVGGKQDKLVSGTNIKTINGESILGSGNISISGGSSGGSGAYAEVNHGTSDTTFTLTPNTFHVWDEVSELNLTLGDETSGVANEFFFQFTSGATATTLSLPSDLKWAEELVIEPNMIYQVSILKGLASVLTFSNAPNVALINFTISGSPCQAEEGMIWRKWVISPYNSHGVYIDTSAEDRVTNADGTYISLNQIWVTADELIVDGGNYIVGK